MRVLVICKTKCVMSGTSSNVCLFSTHGQVTPKRVVRSGQISNASETLYPYRICRFHEDPIKTKQAILRTRSNIDLFDTQGQVTLK